MDRRSQIMEEALRQFNEKGLNRVGVREIARSLGISPGNMSYHFPKKEELVLAILHVFSTDNQSLFAHYHANKKSVSALLELFRSIFHNQFKYRGILTDLVEVDRLLTAATDFDYSVFQKRRVEEFRGMISDLCDSGELQLNNGQFEQLVSYISLFGRFWIAEAFLDRSEEPQEKLIESYLKIFSQHLELFATEKGKGSILAFWNAPDQ